MTPHDWLATMPPIELAVGDYIASTIAGWEQGVILRVLPPISRAGIVMYEVERPDGRRFLLTEPFVKLLGGLSLNQLAWLETNPLPRTEEVPA